MNGFCMIAVGLSSRARGPIPIQDRLRALRNVPAAGVDGSWLWTVVLVVAIALTAAALLIHLARRHARIQAAWENFHRLGAEAGLNDEERGLLGAVARLAGLGGRPETIYTAENAFRAGLARLTEGSPPAGRASGRFGAVCATCTYLVSLREKLGFEPAGASDKGEAVKLGHLDPGETLAVYRQTRPENLQVFVTGHRNGGRELLVLPEVPLEARVGETWSVRYPQASMLWEFDAWVVSNLADEIAIRPSGKARWINRRRFIRVPTRHAAHVARFPFHKAEWDTSAPEFVPARLVEMGGPGMRIEAPLEADVGDRLLVMARLPSRTLETVGAVRHVRPAKARGSWQIALELTGLDTSQIAELARVTNELAPRRDPGDSAESEPAGAYLQESADG